MNNNKILYFVLASALLMLIGQIAKITMLYAIGIPCLIIAITFLGLARKGSLKHAKGMSISLILTLLIQVGSLIIMLMMTKNPENITKTFILGFPAPTFVQFFIFWFLPAAILTLSFALLMNKEIIEDEEMREFERKTGVSILPKTVKEDR